MNSSPDSPAPDTLGGLARVAARAAAVGLGVGAALGTVAIRGDFTNFWTANKIGKTARTLLAGFTVGLPVLAALVALAAFLLFRRHEAPAYRLGRLDHTTRRLLPLALVGFLPLLFQWQIWNDRDVPFLTLVLLFGAAAERAFRTAMATPPFFPGMQARLTALTTKIPTWVPLMTVLVAALAYTGFFSFFTIRYHHYLHTSSFDLALEESIIWNWLHGGHWFMSTPLHGPEGTHFGYHATFFAWVIVPFYALAPRAETLLVIQAALMGGAAIPLFFFARRHLGPAIATVVALGYLLYAPLHGAGLYDFHYLPLGPIFLWATLACVEARRDVWAFIFGLLAVSVREDVGIGLAIFGLYLVLTGQRPRAGALMAALSMAVFVPLKFVVMPRFLGHQAFLYVYQGLLPQGDNGFGGVIKTLISNPGYILTTLLSNEKLIYVLQLMVPLLFLPFRRGLGLLFLVPGFLFTLLSTGYMPVVQTSFQYTTHWTTYMFVGLVLALVWIRNAPGLIAGIIRQRAAVFAFACVLIPTSYQYGAIFQRNNTRGGFGVYKFVVDDSDRTMRQQFDLVASELPRHAKVSSSENLTPQISNRRDAYTLRVGIFDADYLLFTLPLRGDERGNVEPALTSGQFGVVAEQTNFALAKRGADSSRNPSVLSRL